MKDQIDNIFGRLLENGNVAVIYETDGAPVTRLDASVYPVDSEGNESDFSARYEHPEGIILTRADAEKIGIEIE